MNHDFEDEIERSGVPKSRRRPGTEEPRTTEEPEWNEWFRVGMDTEAETESEPRHREPPRSRSKAASGGKASRNKGAEERTGGSAGGRRSSQSEARQRSAKSKRRKIIGWIVAECLALACIFTYAYAARTMNLVQRPDFEQKNVTNMDLAVDTVEKMKGYWTIAVFGVDSRTNNVTKGTNSDVVMLCNINQDTGEIKLASVFRDSYLNINDKDTYNKINQAYAQGGPEQAVKALNKNMDLNITDYVTFNWKAVAQAINILGGVDVEISKAEFYYINSFITETVEVTDIPSVHLKKAGMNHLDGVQAVAYGRLRLMDTDFARTERQRKIIELAFEKAKKADIATLNQLKEVILPMVATSVDGKDILNALLSVSKYHISGTTGFPTARGDANMGKKGACVIPQTLESNVVLLHEFLFGEENYAPSNTVKTISKKIAADTGMYKEGKAIDKVPTDGGYIPKPTQAKPTATEAATKETDETLESSTEESTSSSILPGDELETDESGNPVETSPGATKPSTNPSGSSSAANPSGSTKPSTTHPSESSSGTKPSTTPTTSPTKPSQTASPTKPSQTNPGTTAPSDQNGPGTNPTTAPTKPSEEVPTVPPAPIESSGSSGSGGGSMGPGGSNDSGVVVGTPGP